METKKYEVKIKKLHHAQVEITVSISAHEFDKTRTEALKHIGANAELPGFRKGHVPEKMLVAKIGEASVLEEMAEIAISHAYPEIIREEKLDVLGRPEVRITKIALGNPLEFVLTTAVFPEIKLPDYKKIASKTRNKKNDTVVVTDDELNKTIEQIQSMRAKQNPDGTATEEGATPPAFDDAYVKTLGDFADVNDFKEKLRANMQKEKARAEKDKQRIAIIEAILKEASIELPEVIVEQEIGRMEDEFSHDIARMGLNMESYLTSAKKTKEEMQKEWRPEAEKRAKTQLLIAQIGLEEKIEPDADLLKQEVAALRAQYPDAPEERMHGYVHMLLTNEKVFQMLESVE